MPQADEAAAMIALAEARFADMARSGAMARDPYANALGVLVAVTKAMAASRKVVPAVDLDAIRTALVAAVSEGAVTGAAREARYLGRRIDRRLAVRIGALVGLAFVLGGAGMAGLTVVLDAGRFGPSGLADAAWGQLVRDNPDPRAAMRASPVQVDAAGRRYYSGLAMWAEPGSTPQGRK